MGDTDKGSERGVLHDEGSSRPVLHDEGSSRPVLHDEGSPRQVLHDRFAVTDAALDVAQVASSVAGPDAGAIATFVGLVREQNAGRNVLWLDYEAYRPLARRCFERIAAEAAEHWPSVRLAIHHRIGRLEIGEASVVIAAASPHRADGFAACRYAIERIKQIAPIWKHEHFEGGEVWIEGATADPDDAPARQRAVSRACS